MFLNRLLLAMMLSLPAMGWANDTSFAGEGSNVIPITNADVRMVDEHVVLEGQLNKNRLDAWKVTVTFHFKNESKKAQHLKMGFPFPELYHPCAPNDDACVDVPLVTPTGRKETKSMIYDFKSLVRGQEIKTEEITLDKSYAKDPAHPYSFAYVWDVDMQPEEQIEVVNSYITGVGGSSDGSLYATYVLTTGKNWKGGTIGRSWIEVKPNVPFELTDRFMGINGGQQVKPAAYQIKGQGKDRKVEWILKDYRPESDVLVNFFPKSSASHVLYERYNCMSNFDELTMEDLRIARNTFYALHGYSFKDAELKKYFAEQWWYEVDPNYTQSQITEDEWDLIKRLKAEEDKRKKKK